MKKTLTVLVPSVLALFVASAANAATTFDTPQGKLTLGGDVEYNLDAQHVNAGAVTDDQSANGRILFDVEGERVLSNGNFAAVKFNPTFSTNGDYGDGEDAWFSFGVKNDWAFKMGHYEAYDLSPAGQDTYTIGGDEGYRAKNARGRASSGSQVMLSKEAGQVHAEVSTLFSDDPAFSTSSSQSVNLVTGAVTTTTAGSYHNVSGAVKNKDPIIARPVVAWTGDQVTVAVGAEVNLVTDAYQTAAGNDLSDWTGYGATASFKVSDDLTLALRGAYLDDVAGSSYSVGPNVQYQNFFIAYLNSKNKTETDATLSTTASSTKMNEVYASYKIPGVMGLDNFDMYLGAAYATSKADTVGANTVKDYGGRVRFKYFF